MSAEEATKATEDSPLIPNRILSPEAQCISRVLENCISQVEIAAALPCILQFYAGSGAVDEDLSKILQAHQVLEDRLKERQCQKLESDGLQEKETEEAKREMVQLRESIKNSVRDVLRFFRLHPNVLWDLREKINMEVGESERVLIRMLQMFHSYVVKSLTSEKDLQVPQGQQLLFPEQTLEQLITEEENSAAVLKEIDETILKKDSEIKQLERCLKEDHMQAKYKSSCQTKEEQLKLSILRAEVGSLKQTTDQLNIQLSTLIHENRLAERSLQEKNESVKIVIENIILCFDEKMREMQANLEPSEQLYEKELEELRKLEEPFNILQERYNQIQEKRHLAEEKRKEEIRQLELKTKAAIIIQAWWRGYSVRKTLKNKAKKAFKNKTKKTKKTKKAKGKKTK
ncbi:hypothetical protein GOODEAATRI_013602 [Goodea atripinnis]|uniref:Dynein regulatory complex protein 10 n=1 Tax=Goodea atripinnis TaxID=208336 RepID=A0ABV0MHJ6_9TELE